MYLIKYTLGDWSGDGHGITESFILKSNVNCHSFRDALDRGQKITGINLDRLCSDYDDRLVPNGIYNYLKSKGVVFDKWQMEEYDAYNKFYIEVQQFMDLVLVLAREGNPNLEVGYLEDIQNINSGYGYGLFSN